MRWEKKKNEQMVNQKEGGSRKKWERKKKKENINK